MYHHLNFPKKLDKIKFPPIENEIVKYFLLKQRSKEFNGRVLNISGKVILKDDLTWASQSAVLHSNVKNTGNDNKLIEMYVEDANMGQSSSILKPEIHLKQYPHIIFNKKELVEMKRLDDIDIDMTEIGRAHV